MDVNDSPNVYILVHDIHYEKVACIPNQVSFKFPRKPSPFPSTILGI